MSGPEAKTFFEKSGLTPRQLHDIWCVRVFEITAYAFQVIILRIDQYGNFRISTTTCDLRSIDFFFFFLMTKDVHTCISHSSAFVHVDYLFISAQEAVGC